MALEVTAVSLFILVSKVIVDQGLIKFRVMNEASLQVLNDRDIAFQTISSLLGGFIHPVLQNREGRLPIQLTESRPHWSITPFRYRRTVATVRQPRMR